MRSNAGTGRAICRLCKCQSLTPRIWRVQDLAAHASTFPDPISVNYKGVDVFEVRATFCACDPGCAAAIAHACDGLRPRRCRPTVRASRRWWH